jgi:hypothetical protein
MRLPTKTKASPIEAAPVPPIFRPPAKRSFGGRNSAARPRRRYRELAAPVEPRGETEATGAPLRQDQVEEELSRIEQHRAATDAAPEHGDRALTAEVEVDLLGGVLVVADRDVRNVGREHAERRSIVGRGGLRDRVEERLRSQGRHRSEIEQPRLDQRLRLPVVGQ